ncbi:Dynein heavy chain 1, axonemal [Quaeritorhiza haematococci]|nr:Dynein heavy chain 1, axonemal [Quaeritorhiza haematococci]
MAGKYHPRVNHLPLNLNPSTILADRPQPLLFGTTDQNQPTTTNTQPDTNTNSTIPKTVTDSSDSLNQSQQSRRAKHHSKKPDPTNFAPPDAPTVTTRKGIFSEYIVYTSEEDRKRNGGHMIARRPPAGSEALTVRAAAMWSTALTDGEQQKVSRGGDDDVLGGHALVIPAAADNIDGNSLPNAPSSLLQSGSAIPINQDAVVQPPLSTPASSFPRIKSFKRPRLNKTESMFHVKTGPPTILKQPTSGLFRKTVSAGSRVTLGEEPEDVKMDDAEGGAGTKNVLDTEDVAPNGRPSSAAVRSGAGSAKSDKRALSERFSVADVGFDSELPMETTTLTGSGGVEPIAEQQGDSQTSQRLDFRKALEPKVYLPYEPQPGQTPRRVEIERRKRQYADNASELAQHIMDRLHEYQEHNDLILEVIGVARRKIREMMAERDARRAAKAREEAAAAAAAVAKGGELNADGQQVQRTFDNDIVMQPVEAENGGEKVERDVDGDAMDVSPSTTMEAPNQSSDDTDNTDTAKKDDILFSPLETFAPLEVFDNTEYDGRTISDWLNMVSNPDSIQAPKPNNTQIVPITLTDGLQTRLGVNNAATTESSILSTVAPLGGKIHLATVPVPAKALHPDSRTWKNCLVMAYDESTQRWRVMWQKKDGWSYDRSFPDEDEEEEQMSEDEGNESDEGSNADAQEGGNDVEMAEGEGVEGKDGSNQSLLLKRGEKDKKEYWLPRIHVMFLAEDPLNFADRVAAAYKLRADTVINLCYNFYIDSMPTLPSSYMPEDQLKRIIDMATLSSLLITLSKGTQYKSLQKRRFEDLLKTAPVQEIFDEVRLEHARAMNKVLFDIEVRKPGNKGLFYALALPEVEPTRPVPSLATAVLPKYDYPKYARDFQFSSSLTKVEVVKTWVKVRVECDRISNGGSGAGTTSASTSTAAAPGAISTTGAAAGGAGGANAQAAMNLFVTNITKIVKLDEFEQMQMQSFQNVKAILKDPWINGIKTIIKNGLKDVGKGWYNINETKIEVYKISKLRKFMTMVKFTMQDSLRFLVFNSLNDYLKLIYSLAQQKVVLTGTNDVRILDGTGNAEKNAAALPAAALVGGANESINTGASSSNTSRRPLFQIDLTFRNGKVVYNIDPALYEQIVLSLFDKALTVVEGLPNIEPYVLDQMFWASKPLLQTPHPKEPAVVKLREKLKQAMKDAVGYLETYVRQYDKYLPHLNLDIAQYAADYEAEDHGLEQMEKDIARHAQEWEALERDIPSHISLGLFWVGCESIRTAMRKDLSKVVLDILSRKVSKMATSISNVFGQTMSRLKERPVKIEELTELREYIKTIPDTIKEQNLRIQEMLQNYEILEKYKYEQSNEDFRARWNAIAWPLRIEESVKAAEAALEVDEAAFLRNLVSDQEVFKERINQLGVIIYEFSKHTDLDRIGEIVAEVHKVSMELKECQNLAALFNSRERLFNMEVTHYDELQQHVKDFEPYKSLWLTASDWFKWKASWLHGPFLDLNAEDVEKNLMNAWRNIFKSVKHFKQIPGCLAVANQVKEEMDAFKPNLPLIQALRNPGMRDRHWDRISEELKIDIHPNSEFTLTNLLDMNLLDRVDSITKVSDVAAKEYSIEAALDKMDTEWKNIALDILPYKDSGTFIMRASDEVLRLLDDHIVMTQSMSFSPFKKPFAERIALWESKLRTVQEVLDAWMLCQKSWLYLEPIFSSEDITTQLPVESKRFTTMDRTWRRIMSQAKAKPGVVDFCADYKLLDSFRECNKLLELVSKGLSAYLESKRIAFPRFFFLSDDELLQILSQTKDPTAVQPHLRKCFENVASLEFQKDREITAMFSAEGEKIPISEPFYPKGAVEEWLLKVEDQMRKSVKKIIMEGLAHYPLKPRTEWVLDWPGQVVLSVSQTYWTKEVTEALKTGQAGLKALYQRLLAQLQGLVNLVRGDLPFLNRLVLGDLIVIDVHARDVVKKLLDSGVTGENDFEWISQLRYYWEDGDLRVKIVNANFKYGYEYLGNTGRLVITPLTDRCYLTLTGAMHLGMGGAPAGPAGTGKTETVKDLAKALAKQCVVFNCSDQLDYLAMAKFFKGLASSGAWACFDEFNRIDIEVLSVIAQQITTIQKAAAAGMSKFMFEGVELPLDPTNAIFITMNPGYAGRTELPDNLKALFRPVAMMIPNYAMIAEISLFSFGFSNARVLAEKMVATFKLSSEQLSSQDHYDFGMRAVKTVISSAGNLKRNEPSTQEDLIVLRALCDTNLPKFLADDVPLFNGIISDLFPGVEQPKIDYGDLLESLKTVCEKLGLQPQDNFINKCIQLYETTIVRHGLMLVGPTGGGKTCCLNVLSKAISALQGRRAPNGSTFEKVRVSTMNPKSITMGQLYGEFDLQTHEWTDGILSNLMREGVDDTTPDSKWYVFDGPVDAVWVESMNTLLDDNKKLCLSSGEIIKMTPTQRMVFEVENLAFASPATVSRCGMIYIEPGALGLNPLIKSWVARQESLLKREYVPAFASTLQPLFDFYVESSLEFLRKEVKEAVPTTNGNLVHSLMRIMSCLLKPFLTSDDNEGNAPSAALFGECLEPLFLFSMIWSIGATSDNEGRRKFDVWLRQKMSTRKPAIPIPNEGLVYDYVFKHETKTWDNWMTMAPEFNNANQKGSEVIVPTIDTVRNAHLLHLLLQNNYHVLCTGPTGTGKSVTIHDKIMNGMDPKFTPITFSFSARTSANQTQDMLDSKMEKRRKGVFGPPVGKRFIVFIDDLNMPSLDICNAQPPIELLRQWMDFGGWYDRKNVGKFMEIVDIGFVSAMGPPGGGRNPVTQRFTRHFNLLSFVEMDDPSLTRIFTTILGSFLTKFPAEIQRRTAGIVKASVLIYNTIRAELLPTPAKSHYTFNLRDLSKVIQGLLSADMKTVTAETDIVRLWVHECMRVFQDRLVDQQDKSWFSNMIKSTMTEQLKVSWEEVVTIEPLIYGDYMTPGADPKVYTEAKDLRKLVKLTEEYLDDYNSTTTSPMKLVMFLDAIEHVSRVCRIIRQPGGHALLLGVGGSGRQSLSRLATFMEEYELFQIEVSKSYGLNEWREDLKKVLFSAGLEAKPIVFLFCDTQIFSEACLEDINNILNGGDVPNIYTSDETDRILNAMRPVALDMGLIPTKESLFSLYVAQVRLNLHLILCMSPIGEAFRNRLRMFPSLVNCCTIDWFSTWPQEALKSVAINSLSDVPDIGSDQVIGGIVNLCVQMHESVRERCVQYKAELNRTNYVTPKSYLEMLNLYKSLLDKKRAEFLALRKRTSTGLEKLLNSTKEVEILQEELEAMQPMLLQTSQETEYTMKKIAVDKVKAEEIKEHVMVEEQAAAKKAEETKAIADDAKRDLDEALPALEAAVQSLNNLSKDNIIEVRSMQRPPEGVKLVMEAVCIMKGVKPKKIDGDKPGKKIEDYWEPGRALLADPQKFLDSLLNFDKDNISESTVLKIKPYIDSPEFQVSVISRVSKAATSMCQWVRAMEKYYWVSKSVAPKRARLQEAQESLDTTMKILSELKKKMKEAENNIKEMEKRYTESVAKKEELSRKVEECNIKLSRAGKLISGLGGEKQRWAMAVEDFDNKLMNVVGDTLLAGGAIAYFGAFTAEYRSKLMKEWTGSLLRWKIPHSENVCLWETLGDQVKLREWELHGLPKDSLSRDNALIVKHSRRWPIFIDPQGQANKWVRNMEKENGMDIIKLTDKDFLRTLENAIRFGKPVLLENIGEKLDPALEPVLLRQTFKQGGNTVIKVGDSILPYHEDFRFYMTTKLPNPSYSPETSATVTLVNFTLAPSGLEDQLLAIVVANERPDLSEAKTQLMVNNAQMKRELKDLEDKILHLLSSVQGSPVDDERLIETLAASKETSEEIQTKVAAAEKTERDIDFTRNKYAPVAIRTRILFFCITELANIDPMYQYSLGWFMNLFVSAIGASEKSDDVDQRIININDCFTFSLFSNVCRSLFEKHKLLFSFLLAIRILMDENKIDPAQWKFLLTGGTAAEEKGLQNPAPDWLSKTSWTEIQSLSSLATFTGFDETFADHIADYRAIFDSPQPHREMLPGPWSKTLTSFQKILVLRCLRPDRCTSAIQDFVAEQLGDRFIEPQTSDLSALYKESNSTIPLIFVLSPGADPASSLYKFAEEMRFTKKLLSVSLGQGQGPRAEALIKEGMERGLWILLQNCHLSPSWMPSLDRIIDAIQPEKVHRDFRLWLTSMPTPKFPVSILQNGVKTTIEPPNGIKANLMRTYATFNEDFLNSCTAKPREWKKLLFSLCFFHAIIQERRKFGALGWNIPYEFNEGDLRICVRQLKMFLDEYKEIPFKVLKYTVGEINYGGRVTDDWDRRLIMNILDDFYTPRVLEDAYAFGSSSAPASAAAISGGGYAGPVYQSIPVEEGYTGYRNYIKSLPIDEPTEVFSMHDNANITFAQKETMTLFDTLLTLMPRSGGSSSPGTGKTREEQIAETATSILSKVPRPFPVDQVLKKYPQEYKESMSTVLVQEVIRYNRLLVVIHSTLAEVLKALKGLVVMSESLESIANALFINQVPPAWSAKAYPSLKSLSSWVVDLVARCQFIQTWIDKGIPTVFWISGFFFPQAFLTGTLQNYARKYVVSIDLLGFDFRVVDLRWEEIAVRPSDGCYIRGLFLEGARWDSVRRVLGESRAKELYTEMSVIWLLPKPNRKKPETGIYDCPVYKTLTRAGTLSTTGHSTNYVLTIELPSDQPQSHWIKRGVALITSLGSGW